MQAYAHRALLWPGTFNLQWNVLRTYCHAEMGYFSTLVVALATDNFTLVDHNPDLQASTPTRDTANMSLCMNLHQHDLKVAEATKLWGYA